MAEINLQAASPAQNEPVYKRNFFFFLTDNILFMLAMSIIGPSTLIPDFIRQLTRSEVLIGLSSTLFEVGWTLPQLFIARLIVRFARKKWWFIGPNIPVRFVMLIFAGVTVLLGKDRPESILIAFLICYLIAAIGDGLVGVPWMDLVGTSLNNTWRARMFGFTAALTGLLMLGISPLIGYILGGVGLAFPNNYALVFAFAGVLFVISIIPPMFIHELPGGKAVEKIAPFGEFFPALGRVLRDDRSFRNMLIAKLFTSLFLMAGPFYIGFATVQLGLSSTVAVPTLLAMQTIGALIGSVAISWLMARSSLLYIRVALAVGLLLPISALLASVLGPIPLYVGFLISGMALSNLWMGYQNFVIGHANADQRPTYAGLFNTISAVVALLAPIIGGTIAQNLSYTALFGVALVMGVLALLMTLRFISDTPASARH